jgi:hypothetical protein
MLGLIENYKPPSEEEIGILLDLLLAHPVRILDPFLRQYRLPTYGTKSLIRDRLTVAISSSIIAGADLISYLDEVEGWGNQHIYLYQSTVEAGASWSSEEDYRQILETHGLAQLCNRRNPAAIPDHLHLSAVRCSGDRVRFQWVEKRVREFRMPERDCLDDGVTLKAFGEVVTRGVITFDWDLSTGHAALMILRLPTGTDYSSVKSRIERELEPLVRISGFRQIRLAQAIAGIEESGEARRRQYKHETERGSVASFTSSSRRRDAFDDPVVDDARKALGPRTISLLGNFYWKSATGRLDREIHMKLYPKDRRVGIFGACTEEEVRYLLSRIRHYCL